MSLFYLLTLYCFIRGASVEGAGIGGQGSGVRAGSSSFILPPVAWYIGSVSACLLGMSTKEVMVSAPVMVLLYDRTFCAGSFREAWRRRHALYLGLASTWMMLGYLTGAAGNVARPDAYWEEQFTWWSYLLTQPGVIAHYLQLAFWPSDLCLDYGWPAAKTFEEVLLPGTLIVVMAVLTLWAIVKRPAWGFLGAWFFAILAPLRALFPSARLLSSIACTCRWRRW